MGLYRRRWTPKEEEYLQENWGKYSIPAIAKKLGKSVNAIKVRANRLALPNLKAIVQAAYCEDGNDLLCDYCNELNCPNCIIQEWKEELG